MFGQSHERRGGSVMGHDEEPESARILIKVAVSIVVDVFLLYLRRRDSLREATSSSGAPRFRCGREEVVEAPVSESLPARLSALR